MGRATHPLGDGLLGVRIARILFQRGELVEQLGDKLTFLGGHRISPVAPVMTALIWGVTGAAKQGATKYFLTPYGTASATPWVASMAGNASLPRNAYSLARRSVSGSSRSSSASTRPGWHMMSPASGRQSRKRGNKAAKSAPAVNA